MKYRRKTLHLFIFSIKYHNVIFYNHELRHIMDARRVAMIIYRERDDKNHKHFTKTNRARTITLFSDIRYNYVACIKQITDPILNLLGHVTYKPITNL